MDRKSKDIIDALDREFGQTETYMWSTYILPNGRFLNPEHSDELEELTFEHQDFVDWVFQNFNAGEPEIMEQCIKLNVTYPYLILPDESRITPEQTSAIKDVIQEGMRGGFDYEVEDIYSRIDKEVERIARPLLVQQEILGNRVFDLDVYRPNDIIKEIMRAYSKGTF